MGVDFAVHFLLRLEEIRRTDQTVVPEAVYKTGGDMGQSLLICALTTAIGFYAFMPTTYRGVAELGLISGTGMLISFLITITMIPALQRFFPIQIRKPSSPVRLVDKILDLPGRSHKLVYSVTTIAILVSILALPQIKFDYNLLNLNNPSVESVKTFQELLKSTEDSPWHINILVDDFQEIGQIAQQLSTLPEVKRVISILDLVPDEQEEKSLLIEEMAMILGPISYSSTAFLIPSPHTVAEQRMALDQLRIALSEFIVERPEHAAAVSARALQESIANLLVQLDKPALENSEAKQQLLLAVNNDLLSLLPGAIKRLQVALEAQPFSQEALPSSVTELWYGKDNVYRIAVYPSENINDNDALRRFVRAVQKITPNATGVPVISLEAGEAVVDAFFHAFSLALIGVILTIWIMLRSATATFMVLIPLLIAILLTGASTVLMDLSFNFANIIALPLLLGIGLYGETWHQTHSSRRT